MKWKMTEFLDLDEEQAEKFFPKFNSYHKDHKQKDSEIKKIFDEVQLMVKKEEVNQKKIENCSPPSPPGFKGLYTKLSFVSIDDAFSCLCSSLAFL